MIRKIIYSTLLLFIIFMVINVLGSLLPIGVGAVGELRLESHTLDELDYDQATMQLMLTEDRMSFVSSRPSDYYSLEKFYNRNTLLSLASAFLLSVILFLLKDMDIKKRVLVCSIFGLLIITSVHLSYWNWWGFSNLYSIGVSLSTFISLLLSSLLSSHMIFRKNSASKNY